MQKQSALLGESAFEIQYSNNEISGQKHAAGKLSLINYLFVCLFVLKNLLNQWYRCLLVHWRLAERCERNNYRLPWLLAWICHCLPIIVGDFLTWWEFVYYSVISRFWLTFLKKPIRALNEKERNDLRLKQRLRRNDEMTYIFIWHLTF